MIKKYFCSAIIMLFLILLAEISEARSIGYFLFCASNSSMSAEIFNSHNSYVLDNARWKILGSPVGPTNFPSGYVTTDNMYGDGTYYINFLRIRDFYPSPVEVRVIENNGLKYTNWYHVYSNSLSVVVTGLNVEASAAWQLTAFPTGEFTNTTCYSLHGIGSYTGNVTLTAIPTGTYSIAFEQKKGYYAMPATNIAITGAPYDWYSTNYFVAYSNSLAVVASGVTSGSNVVWTLTAANSEYTNTAGGYGLQFTNSYTLSLIPTGIYTITWPEMPGYTTPAATTTNITESSPLINTVTGLYVPVVWGNNSNAPWTNPPSGTVPTNFPPQTNDITLMVDSNGVFKTPSAEKIISANGLITTAMGEPAWSAASNKVVYTNDSRLTDAREPLAHAQSYTTITDAPWLSSETYQGTITGATIATGAAPAVVTNNGILELTVPSGGASYDDTAIKAATNALNSTVTNHTFQITALQASTDTLNTALSTETTARIGTGAALSNSMSALNTATNALQAQATALDGSTNALNTAVTNLTKLAVTNRCYVWCDSGVQLGTNLWFWIPDRNETIRRITYQSGQGTVDGFISMHSTGDVWNAASTLVTNFFSTTNLYQDDTCNFVISNAVMLCITNSSGLTGTSNFWIQIETW